MTVIEILTDEDKTRHFKPSAFYSSPRCTCLSYTHATRLDLILLGGGVKSKIVLTPAALVVAALCHKVRVTYYTCAKLDTHSALNRQGRQS